MARAKLKVEFRLMRMLSEFREMHAAESSKEDRKILAELVVKQAELLEWAMAAFPDRKRKPLVSMQDDEDIL